MRRELPRAGRRVPRRRDATRRPARGGRGGDHARLGTHRRLHRRHRRHDDLRSVRTAEGPIRALRLHRGEHRRSRQEGRRGRCRMSVAAEVNERLARITELGTSIWLDQIRLNLIESGELERLVKYESLRGVTSNPAIFEKAILGSDDYDELIE